jgi:predicted O-linked N-acetylglucosamine transferase (SPINDLY family)
MQDNKGAYKILELRLKSIFTKNNLDYKSLIIFIPNLTRNGFNSLMKSAKLQLDTPYFSSFNTSMQALGNGLPVVTRHGNFMRSRATSGMLKMVEVTELIAFDDNEYINIVVKLTVDENFYNKIKNKIINNVDKLYRDSASILSLENFFINEKKGSSNKLQKK